LVLRRRPSAFLRVCVPDGFSVDNLENPGTPLHRSGLSEYQRRRGLEDAFRAGAGFDGFLDQRPSTPIEESDMIAHAGVQFSPLQLIPLARGALLMERKHQPNRTWEEALVCEIPEPSGRWRPLV